MGCVLPYPNENYEEEDYCETEYFPFYELNKDVDRLEVECACQDSMVDLGMKLLPFTEVVHFFYNCSEAQFNLIPPMSSVTHLNSQFVTENLPTAFPSLKRLELNGTMTFYDGLENVQLESFYLDYYRSDEIPAEMTQLTNLTALRIWGEINSEPAIPTDIGNLTNLQTLNLLDVQDLPNSVSDLENLTYLYVKGNAGLKPSLPSNIGNLTNLETLVLKNTNTLPMSLAQLTNLDYAYIELESGLTPIPAIFDDMDALEKLTLFGMVEPETQVSIYNAENLKELILHGGSTSTLEPEISQLTNLEELDISGNPISTFPSSIGTMTNLKSLKCWTMPITDFPMEIVGLTNLEYLGFRFCQLTSVPPEIGNFTNLKTLSFSLNQLTTLPDEIGNLKDNLQTLFLSENNFSQAEKNRIKAMLPNTTIHF